MIDRDRYMCRVCGLDHFPDLPWGENGQEPSNNICQCCGVEFGYEDDATVPGLAELRRHWVLTSGCRWFSPKFKPDDWDMPAQIRGIAAEFAGPDDEKLIAHFLERVKN